ncbi:unnamed protein product, partial [Allacma fusca]
NLWEEKIGWDDPLPDSVLKVWSSIQSQLTSLEVIRIPRHAILPESLKLELLGFCDASEKAYAAVVFLKSSSPSATKISLLIAKTRVAPRKKETLPRLELCGAALLSKVVDAAKKFLKRDISGVHLWTDSTIVLAWLANPTSWKTFVSHRITDIVKNYPRSHWHHVKSGDNPADPASRGTLPNDLQDLFIWWNGPSWSKDANFNFAEEIQPSLPNPMPEVRKVKALLTTSDFPILERYSSLTRLLRVVAMCLRISPERRTPVPGQEFSVSELLTSLQRCISLSQSEAFSQEIQALQGNLTLNKRSKILPLSPFLDSVGLLRVGGRLRHSSLPEDQKHPILLPSSASSPVSNALFPAEAYAQTSSAIAVATL